MVWVPMSNQTPFTKPSQRTLASSDHILFTSLLPFGLSAGGASNELAFMASLDHSLYFHCSFRTDDWLLFETEVMPLTWLHVPWGWRLVSG
jgi:acyl-CoA thioesterase